MSGSDMVPALQERLLRYMESIVPPASVEITPETEVFTTGLFDSLALVQLVLWVEAEIGRPLDPRGFDLQQEWMRVRDIATFVVRERGKASEHSRDDRPTGVP